MINLRRLLALVLVCGSLLFVSASPPVIGVAQSVGAFRLNQASVPGSATILDGSSVQTGATSSNINLKTGQRLLLASSSAAEIHGDRLVLSKGAAELSSAAAYRIDTRSLQIGATDPTTSIRVMLDDAKRVRVSATGGRAEVRNSQGILLAQVSPGSAVQVPSGEGTPTKFTGVVTQVHGKYLLTDEATKVTVELRGTEVARFKGKHVQVTGAILAGETPAAGASQIIIVTQAVAVKVAAGAAAAGAATSTGISTATIGVIGGAAAAAGTVGGLYAADVIGGSDTPTSR